MYTQTQNNMHTIDDVIEAFTYTILALVTSEGVGNVISNHPMLQIPMRNDFHEICISICKYGIGSAFSITTFVIIFFVKRFLDKKYKTKTKS